MTNVLIINLILRRNFMKFKIFLSSTMQEFENERKYVKN